MKNVKNLLGILFLFFYLNLYAQNKVSNEKHPHFSVGLITGSYLEFLMPNTGEKFTNPNLWWTVAPIILFHKNNFVSSAQYDFVRQELWLNLGLVAGRQAIASVFYHPNIPEWNIASLGLSFEKILEPSWFRFVHQHEIIIFSELGIHSNFKKEIKDWHAKPFVSAGFFLKFNAWRF